MKLREHNLFQKFAKKQVFTWFIASARISCELDKLARCMCISASALKICENFKNNYFIKCLDSWYTQFRGSQNCRMKEQIRIILLFTPNFFNFHISTSFENCYKKWSNWVILKLKLSFFSTEIGWSSQFDNFVQMRRGERDWKFQVRFFKILLQAL